MSCEGKCQNCLLPAIVPGANLNSDSVCGLCSSDHGKGIAEAAEVRRDQYKADLERTLQECRGKAEYDCLVNLSGGKDSCLLLHKLKCEYGLNVLAFTTDINIPEIAWKNIRRTVELLDVPHVTYRPPIEFYKKMFRFLLSHQESRGAVRTVCYVCAPLFEGYSLRFAIEKGIPLVVAGYAPGQPEPDRMEYEFSRDILCNDDWTPPELIESGQFSDQELSLFWNPHRLPKGTEVPRYIAPFHAWDYSQEEAIDLVVKLGLIKNKKSANPIHSNCPINWLLMYSDLKHLGFNPYAPEFSKLIREGKANRNYWRFIGPLVNLMIRNKVLLGRNVAKSLSWLNMKESELAITRENQGAEYADQIMRRSEPKVMTWNDVAGKHLCTSAASPASPATTIELIRERIQTDSNEAAFGFREATGKWNSITWSQFGNQILDLAHELRESGVNKGDRVAVYGRPELGWAVAEFAIQCVGAVVVGLDIAGNDDSMSAIIDCCQPNTIVAIEAELPHRQDSSLELPIIRVDLQGRLSSPNESLASLGFDAFDLPCPTDIASIVFTSGTTGAPKGVAYTHQQFMDTIEEINREFPLVKKGDATICWLPMNHLFQRMMNLVSIRQGAQVFFEPDPKKLLDTAKVVHPVVMVAVPRMIEKLAEGIESSINSLPSIASRTILKSLAAKDPSSKFRHRMIQSLIRHRAKNQLGSKLSYLVCGSAPLSSEAARKLEFVGWKVLEAYGVSENILPVAVNRPTKRKLGTVGHPLPSNEVKIAHDGEILVKGPGCIKRYWRQDNDVLDENGYLSTGDLGFFDPEGFLVVTGRKDNQIKTSTGRKLQPEPIEHVYQQSRFVADITVHGHGQKFLVGLIVPSSEFIDACEAMASTATSRAEALNSEAAILMMKDSLAGVEGSLEKHERLADFRILAQPFQLLKSEVTSSLKKRRGQIETSYQSDLESMYRNDHKDKTLAAL